MEKDKILSSAMADEEINKLVERKNAIVNEVAEKRSAFDSSSVETRDAILDELTQKEQDVDAIDKEIEELRSLKETFAKQEERLGMIRNLETEVVETRNASVDQYDTPEYRSAWKKYVLTNDVTELRAAGLTTATDYVPIPTLMQGYVETAWEKFGKFSRLVNKTRFAGYLAIPYEVSATGAVVHDEGGDAVAEEEIVLGQIELKPAMLKKWISLTDELRALSPDDFMRYIADELVYRVILALDHGIINGAVDTNGKGVVGIVDNALTEVVTGDVSFNIINEAVAALKTFDNLVVAMNQATFFKNIMGLTDLQGRPIYTIAADNEGRPRYFINGLRIEFTDALKDFDTASAGDTWAIVGNFANGYRLNLPEGDGVRTLVDPYTLMTVDKVRMLGRLYAAGNIVKLGHFAQIEKGE